MSSPNFYPKLDEYTSTLAAEFELIPADRKEELKAMSRYISNKIERGEAIDIVVICTHNSRRSHMGQLWLWAASHYYGISDFHSFSGGTEATAFYPSAVKAMKEAGFKLEKMNSTSNPIYQVSINENIEKLSLFSKKYANETNPSKDFAALLVCSSADAACPIVNGADGRFAIPYRDPKEYDGTEKEASAYAERCRQIAREMFYAMKNVRSN